MTPTLRPLARRCLDYPVASSVATTSVLLLAAWASGLSPWLVGVCAPLLPMLGWHLSRRKQAGQAHCLSDLVHQSPCAALLVTENGHILLANRHCAPLFGMETSLRPGTLASTLPAPWNTWLSDPAQVSETRAMASLPMELRGQACRLLLIDRQLNPDAASAGKQPLSPRTHQILQQIVDVIPHPVYLKDHQGHYVLVNEAFARERNLSVAQIQGQDAAALGFTNHPLIQSEDQAVLDGQVVLKEETAVHPEDGTTVYRTVSKRRSLGEHGLPIIVGAHFDVTPWRRAEAQLLAEHDHQKALRERAQTFIQRVIDVIPDPVYVKDRHSRFLLVNKAFGRERGLPPEQIVGKTSFDLAPDTETLETVRLEDEAVLAGGEVSKEQHTTHPVSGAEVFRVVSKRLCHDADNEPVIVGAHFDLTRWKIAERELTEAMTRERAQRLRVQAFMQRMIDVIPQPMYLKDAHSRYIMINEAFARFLDMTPEQIIGHGAEAWAPPEQAAESAAEDRRILAGEHIYKEERRPHPQTGQDMYRIVTKRACLDADNQPVIVGANFDITEWRVAERELKLTIARERDLRERVQDYIQRLIDVIPQPVYVKDAQSRYLLVNKAMTAEIGRPAEELIGRNPLDLGASQDYAELVMDEDARIVGGELVYKEEHIRHPYRGQESFRIISKGSCPDANGEPVIVGANFDITALRQAERQARDALAAQSHVRDFLQSLIGALPTPLYVEDSQGKLLIVNRAFRQLIGELRRDLIGTGTIEYGPNGLRRALAHCHSQAMGLEEGHVFETEFHFNTEDGARHYLLRAVTGRGVEGQSVVVGILSDVSTQREAEARWAQAKEEAERASKAKSLFLASMSHEIRTPLAGVIGTLDIALRREDMPAAARELVDNGLANARSLLSIINDILDFSKIEAGQLTLEHIDFDLRAVAVESLRILQGNAKARSLRLIIDIDPTLPHWLKGDPTRIRQILINLVGNALKFTQRGSVALRATLLDRNGSRNRVRFRVEDTGIGIPADVLPRLFGKFQQADISTTRKYGGTGLGLAICRELVEAMGGEISVSSKPGVGSTFEFVLPLEAGQAPAEADNGPLPPHTRSLQILCAEDYSTNQIIIRALLEDMGHHVDMADTGLAALKALAARDYDIVLMDGRMPEMDGLDAVRCIRKGGHESIRVRDPQLPVVALTANASTEDRAEYLTAGMNDFLTKPVELRQLHDVLSRVIAGHYHTAPPPPPAVNAASPARPAGISPGLHARLLKLFAAQLPPRRQELDEALAKRDLSQLSRVAHGLRGSASMLGAQTLATAAAAVEDAVRQGREADALTGAATLQVAMDEALNQLSADIQE